MNQLIGSLTTAFALNLGLVIREGIDVDLFMQIVRDSALYAPTLSPNYYTQVIPTRTE